MRPSITFAAQGHVNDAALIDLAVRQDQPGGGVLRHHALVPASLVEAEPVPVDEPGELIDDLLALVRPRHDPRREAALDRAHDNSLDTAEDIEIDDDDPFCPRA
jgi:hypothetical protein